LNKRDIPCLNVTPNLIRDAETTGERLYFWLDVHWTPRGNFVAARSVASHLVATQVAN
jgi:hypothetical protein